MKTLKRTLCLVLALALSFSVVAGAANYDTYADADAVAASKYAEAADVVMGLGIIKGADGNKVALDGTLTRAMAAKLLAYLKLGETTAEALAAGETPFSDVPANHWASKYIAYAASEGIIVGSEGKFSPDGEVTGYGLAKLILNAMGDGLGTQWVNGTRVTTNDYEGSYWFTNVSRDAGKIGLFAGLEGVDLNKALTRGQAMQMIYTALAFQDAVEDGEKTTDFPNITLAYDLDVSTDYDVFDRPATVIDTEGTTKAWDEALVYAKAADYVITLTKAYTGDLDGLTALVKDVIAATGVKKMTATNAINTGKVSLDGTPVSAGNAALFTEMSKVAQPGTVVELYVADDGITVENIVAYATYADVVETVTEADAKTETEASVTLANSNETFKTDAFAEDDVVLYTIANGEVQTMVKAASVTGKLTSYTSAGKYTIGGIEYEVAATYLAVSGFNASDVVAQYGEEYTYYLNAAGQIVYGTTPAGEAPAVITDYAKITDTKYVVTANAWGEATAVTAQVKAVLSNGQTAAYDLAVAKATTGDNKDKFVYTIGTTEVVVPVVDGNGDLIESGELSNLKNNVYTYTLDGTKIALAAKLADFAGNETADAVVKKGTMATIKKTSTLIALNGGLAAIANSDTVFILNDGEGNLVVKTGLTALESTVITGAKTVVVDVDYDAKTTTRTAVAKVVFAEGITFGANSAELVADSYVYVDGTYTTTYNAKGEAVYTYNVVKADGSKVDMTGNAGLTEGIYTYNADNTLASKQDATEVEVGTIAGTTYKLGDAYVTINSATVKIVVADGAALETGAKVMYMAKDGVASIVFVTDAKPAE